MSYCLVLRNVTEIKIQNCIEFSLDILRYSELGIVSPFLLPPYVRKKIILSLFLNEVWPKKRATYHKSTVNIFPVLVFSLNLKILKSPVADSEQRLDSEAQYMDTELEDLVDMLRSTNDMEIHGDILHYMVNTYGLTFKTSIGVIKELVK